VVTVPIVEELAFRGYLMRRLSAAEFEKVALPSVTWLAVLSSSLVFGVMHGERWVAGTLAGICYGVLTKRAGRIGEAFLAHAVTNALLAAAVILKGNFQYW